MQSLGVLTPEKGELVGALMGDKGTFRELKRYVKGRGSKQATYKRCVMSLCLGKDRYWGDHLAKLLMKSYGIHGTTYFDGREWLFWVNSPRVFRDLSTYYSPDWNCYLWRVTEPIFEASPRVKEMVIRGYLDADGYPNFSKARNQVSLKVTSANRLGVESMKELLLTIGYRAGVYRRYRDNRAWELCVARQADVVRFYDEIGFTIERKQDSLKSMLIGKGLIARSNSSSEGRI